MLKRICGFFTTIILILLIAVAVIFILPGLLKGKSLAVLTGSMEPKIKVGSLVVCMPAEVSEIVPGDIITYKLNSETLVTHRVVENNNVEKIFTTKGDANEVVDSIPVPYENVVGKVLFSVPLLGYIALYIKTPLGIAGICVLLFVLILLTFLPEVFAPEKKDSKQIEEDD
ncbi:MAG: signal peptidase I [Lachnospiraceae bacterium]|nr:signal peptidase I [Lachnospiraceae bacterium]